MKYRIYFYFIIIILWQTILHFSEVEDVIIGLNSILMVLIFILSEIIDINNKNN